MLQDYVGDAVSALNFLTVLRGGEVRYSCIFGLL